jgi:serine/threonine-protein kinase
MLVLFVLLTLAAVAVGVMLFRGGFLTGALPLVPAQQGAGTGTVASREGVLAGSGVPGGPLTPVIVTASGR